MRKNKLFKLAATAMLALSMALVGCGGAATDKTPETPAETPATDAGEQTGKDLNVAILINGTLGDKAFFDSAANGGKMMEEQLGANVKVVEMTYDETKWMPTLIDFSEDPDYDVIIVGTWQLTEKLEEVAPQYPDKKYIIYDSSVNYDNGDLENVYSIEYKQNQCSFLAGAVAASTTKTGTIGFVGGMENFVINDFLLGYIQGAKYVNPDIKIATAYVGNFSDSARAKELALAQINQGADVVYQVASTAGLGVIDAAAETGKWVVGVDSDQSTAMMDTDAKKANQIITSALKRVDESIFRAIDLHLKGELPWGQKEVLGLQEKAVGIAKNEVYEKNVPDDVKQKMDEIEKGILDGSIEVDTAFGKTTEEIQAVKDSVRP